MDAGRVDDHPAAGAQHLPVVDQAVRPQVPRGHPGAGDGAQVHQGPSARTVPQQGVFRRRRVWHRRREPQILRAWRGSSDVERSRDHRRAGQGAVALFADRRCRGCGRPGRGGDRADEGDRQDFLRRGGVGRPQGGQAGARAQPEQRTVFHRLGAAPARKSDRRTEPPARSMDDDRHQDAGRRRYGDPRQRARPTRRGR